MSWLTACVRPTTLQPIMRYKKEFVTDRLVFEETRFDQLMQKRILEVLMLCSNYDRFILEEDGRIDEQLFQEYVELGLRYPPRLTTAPNNTDALTLLDDKKYDLVVVMLGAGEMQPYDLCHHIKDRFPDTPLVALIRGRMPSSDIFKPGSKVVDHVFNWLGDANILLAIVKLIEDQMNVEHDVHDVGVQTILLVENSVRYYSTYLPTLYRALFKQARELMREGLNEHQQTMRMRGRPKVLLARNYEEAVNVHDRFRTNMLGVISDISYEHNGELDPTAGFRFSRYIRSRDPELPILLQSSHEKHASHAGTYNAAFLHKASPTLLGDLIVYIRDNYGFGPFVFRMPGTFREIARAEDLVDLQRKLATVDGSSLEYHFTNHHFSKWLKARALFTLANVVRPKLIGDFDDVESAREYLVDTISNYRMHVGRGTIAEFDKDKFDEYVVFDRIGDGSLGGKARGIAFANSLLKRNRIMFRYDNVTIQIPKTVVVTTSIFDRFMEAGNLYDVALSDKDDDEILRRFLEVDLPEEVLSDLARVVSVIKTPLAARSSSLLEDSLQQPFAGVYATYFLTNNHRDINVRVKQIADAIKGVYASTYYRDSKSYALSTHDALDEEKMAVVIQEVTGSRYGDLYYPNISGVARSLDFYPVARERTDEGVANIALGLGKTVVDGKASLRFSPKHPKKIMQLADPESVLRLTQQQFFAIDMSHSEFKIGTDDSLNLVQCDLEVAAEQKANRLLLSTYDMQNNTIRDDPNRPGRKVATFASVLRYNHIPLAEILDTLLEVGQKEMNTEVEIEFAVNIDKRPMAFKFLQIRPVVEESESENVRIGKPKPEDIIVAATTALGNGKIEKLYDVIYVNQDSFDPANTQDIARRVNNLNRRLKDEGRDYILIGPGRWGSTDPWLGIPVKWAFITNARVIVEAGMRTFRVDASQGSHFFHNLTAFRTVYLTVDPSVKDGSFDIDFLNAQPAFYEDEHIRHVRFEQPMLVKVNGRAKRGELKAVVLKPVSN